MGPYAQGDIIIADTTFRNEGKRAKEISENSEETIENIISVLTAICDSELTEGNVAENFRTYTNSIVGLKGQLGTILQDQATHIENFISNIDEADQYVYPASSGGVGIAYSSGELVRDFSSEMKEILLSKVQENDYDYLTPPEFSSGLPTVRAGGMSAIKNYESALRDWNTELIRIRQINSTTKDSIHTIWDNVSDLDRSYGDKFSNIRSYLDEYSNAIIQLTDLIKDGGAKFFSAPEDFNKECSNILAETNNKALQFEMEKLINPDGTYNWNGISNLLHNPSGILNTTQLLALSSVVTTMNGTDMEKFLSLGYGIPNDYIFENGFIYYEYTNLDGTTTKFETQVFYDNPSSIGNSLPMTGPMWYFCQFYTANTNNLINQVIQNGTQNIDNETLAYLNNIYAHSQILFYSMAFYQTAIPNQSSASTNPEPIYPNNIIINSDGSFSMGISYESVNFPYNEPITTSINLWGSAVDFNGGTTSQEFLNDVLNHALNTHIEADKIENIINIISTSAGLGLSALSAFSDFVEVLNISDKLPWLTSNNINLITQPLEAISTSNEVYNLTSNLSTLAENQILEASGHLFTRDEILEYIKRLTILGINYSVTMFGENQGTVSIISTNDPIAFLNWKNFLEKQDKYDIDFETYKSECLNTNVSDLNSSIVLSYSSNGNSNLPTQNLLKELEKLLMNTEFLAAEDPDGKYPTDINLCSPSQLEALYQWHNLHNQ